MNALASYIASHGFTPTVTADAVSFSIPFSNVLTGETGADLVTVRTFAEARLALGY